MYIAQSLIRETAVWPYWGTQTPAFNIKHTGLYIESNVCPQMGHTHMFTNVRVHI